jgi:hypothetical protein
VSRKLIRKFIVTVEELLDDGPDAITHQQPPPIQTRDGSWFKGQKRRHNRAGDGVVKRSPAGPK